MLFAILLHYRKPLAEIDAVRPDHLRHLERQAARGAVRAWARRDPAQGSVVIVSAPSRSAVDAMVAEDPYVRAGLATAEVVEFSAANVRGLLG